MKRWKMFGVAVAVSALAAFALTSAVSANTVTDSAGNGTPTIHFVSVQGPVPGTNHVVIHNSSQPIECESTVTGHVTVHGAGVTTSGDISELEFFNCTGWQVEVTSNGTFEIHTTSVAGHGDGTMMWSGGTLVATRFGISCGYRTENTRIGTLTGGNPATLHLEASIPRHSGSFLCGGSNANFTGAYNTTETLKFHA